MNNKPAYLSREGLEKLRAELDELVNVRRAEVATRIQEAKEHGDITENAEYEDAKNEQAFIEGRIQTLSALIKNAVIIDENHSTTHVQIGSTVELEGDGGKETYTIVGSAEASPARGSDLQRVAGRPGAAGPQEGRQGQRVGARRGLGLQDRQHQLTRAGHRQVHRDVLGGRAGGVGRRGRRSSTIPRRRRAPSTSAACVASCCTTPSRVRSREHGTPTEFRYGVDDLDPMDSQALLTPDAVERYMGVPLAHVPAPGGQRRAELRPPLRGQLFMGTFAGLGIQPEIYWMSERYGDGRMDPLHPHRARPGGPWSARSTGA